MQHISLKDYVKNYAQSRYYFNIQDLRKHFLQNGINYTEENLKKSIYRMKKDEIIFNSGRGWYSTISKRLVLDIQPVKKIIELIEKNFPFLEFSCWSTEQIKAFFHHLPSQFVTFLYSEKDYLQPLKDFLENKDFNVFLNPLKSEADKFVIFRNRAVILRPSVAHREPKDGYFARIEKIIVDLYMETKKLNLIDMEEYKRLVSNIIHSYRINISEMLEYAERRGIKDKIETNIESSIMSTNAK